MSEYTLLFGSRYLYIEHTSRMAGRHAHRNDKVQNKSPWMRAFICGLVIRLPPKDLEKTGSKKLNASPEEI